MKLSREYCSCYHKNMADTLVIAVLAGTTRVQRKSVRAAKYVADFGRSLKDVEIIFADPNDFNFAGDGNDPEGKDPKYRSEEHTSELQSPMRNSYAVFCLQKKNHKTTHKHSNHQQRPYTNTTTHK